jgi:hypothetical protein
MKIIRDDKKEFKECMMRWNREKSFPPYFGDFIYIVYNGAIYETAVYGGFHNVIFKELGQSNYEMFNHIFSEDITETDDFKQLYYDSFVELKDLRNLDIEVYMNLDDVKK